MFGGQTFGGAPFAGVTATAPLTPPTALQIWLGGQDVSARVRKAGVTIRDVLNDAPNTASLTFDGPAVPQVGLPLVLTLGGQDVLFSGALQTVDRSYEGGKPSLLHWPCTAIDDTAAANRRRPFGSWVTTSASTVAAAIAAYAPPGFTTAIAPDLPPVTIHFDGSETMIAALVRLANLIGGYAKIEQRTIYLFIEDPTNPPDPVDAAHPPLNEPPLAVTTDASQLRTRVYGKGYGENVPADVSAGETLVPILDGAQFTPGGGQAIAGTEADSAQSQIITYAGVSKPIGGTLVGPGAAPANAPTLGLATGGVVTNGVHQVGVVHVTAAGKSLVGPLGSIDVNPIAPPATAPTANAAIAGTGPDAGTHYYVVTFEILGGETTHGPNSPGVVTSSAVGQLPAPGPVTADFTTLQGAGCDDGGHSYKATFTNGAGETEAGAAGNTVVCESRLIGQTSPVTPPNVGVSGVGLAGGNIEDNHVYTYYPTFTTAAGETTVGAISTIQMRPGEHSANIPLAVSADPRVTGRKLYRLQDSGSSAGSHLVATIANNTANNLYDTVSQASIAGAPAPPTVDTTANPGTLTPFNRINVTGIPTGPAGTTGRKLYRLWQNGSTWRLVTTLGNNTQTTYIDSTPYSSLSVDAPSSNTTGTAVQRVPLSAIPIGPPGTTARKIYRSFNSSSHRLVTTLANNTATTYTDSTPNSGLGALAPTVNTATGNQIALSNIPTGSGAVTAREIYMSLAGGSVLRLALTIANNVDRTGTLNVSDATLMSQPVPPSSDTSGLTQPPGQVNPGSPTLIVASPAPFNPGGGWVVTGGGQVLRYTGLSGQLLTGIPASGAGAIVTTILYGQQATPAPTLIGVAGLTKPMAKGAAIHIWVQRDDLLAQAEQAARDGSDGVVEFLFIDQRMSEPALIKRCEADLALFSRPILTVRYTTHDRKTRSGKRVSINLPPYVTAVLTIQDVTISQIDVAKNLSPRYTVTASSVRWSLEDTLRRLVGEA